MNLHCRIEMLGPLRVVEADRTLTRFGTQKAGHMLAYLALRGGRPVAREVLLDLFWGDMDLSAGRDNLSTTLSTLRRLLEPPGVPRGGMLRTDRTEVSLNADVFATDVAEFERLYQQAQAMGIGPAALGLWEQAAALYRDDFLPGCYLDWAVRESERLHSLWVGALADWTRGLERAVNLEGAREAARRWAAADAYAEEAQETLVRLLIQTGRPDAARDAYRALEQMLRDEFGTVPAPEISQLVQKRTDPARVVTPSRSEGTYPSIPPPETALPSLSDGGPHPAPIPASFSRFFGREPEMALLDSLLTTPTPPEEQVRIVTLTGPGGMGKTRLATEWARSSGLWTGFIPLADVSRSDLVLPHIAQALRLTPPPGGDPLEQIAGFFATRREGSGGGPALLILDNLEQIDGVGAAVRALLERAPDLRCLCTSRRRLGLRGERLIPLTPLAVPEHEGRPASGESDGLSDLLTYPSVRLYVDRAQAVRPDFQITPGNVEAVAGLCRALEGSPLALELAASWVRSLPPRAMWERLSQGQAGVPGTLEARYDDLPARHRSLWAALDWSFRLLPERQQRLFARLSVFRGGWTLDACESVCDEPDALGLLTDLEDASLIRSTETGDGTVRWQILETVRQHAQARLSESWDAERTASRHLDVFLALAERAELDGNAQTRWFDALEADHDNLRAALDFAATDAITAERGLRLAAALLPFWRARSYLAEGQRRTAALLVLPTTSSSSAVRAKALNCAGVLAMLQSDYATAEAYHQEALEIARASSDAHTTAAALLGLGNARFYSQDYTTAERLFQDSLTLRQATDDVLGTAAAYHCLGNVAYRDERYDDAVGCFEQALRLRRQQGDTLAAAATLGGLGQVEIARENPSEASRLVREALHLFVEAGQQWTVALCLENLSRIAEIQDQNERAVRLLGAGTVLRERYHFLRPPAERAGHEEHLAELRDLCGAAAFDAAWSVGRGMTWQEAVADAQRGQETPSIRS